MADSRKNILRIPFSRGEKEKKEKKEKKNKTVEVSLCGRTIIARVKKEGRKNEGQ
jgi:hypothetical protein